MKTEIEEFSGDINDLKDDIKDLECIFSEKMLEFFQKYHLSDVSLDVDLLKYRGIISKGEILMGVEIKIKASI